MSRPAAFFADHLKRYSKSRRKAPIYWPLSTQSGSYTLWLYYHRLTNSTLYQCVNDFVDPKIAATQRQLTSLRSRKRTQNEESELEKLSDLARELETFRTHLLTLAKFWRPNLNDGVQITAAPLHPLFGLKKWRDTLSETWETLQAGEYDWAHLAMSIWPSRVVPKCTTDRSLAIAHDIETLFWIEENNQWRQLLPPDQERSRQIEQRQKGSRDRLRTLFTDLATGEKGDLAAGDVWQALHDGTWDASPLGIHLFPERAMEAAFEDSTSFIAYVNSDAQKLLAKKTHRNKTALVKQLIGEGSQELVGAIEATLADCSETFATLWNALQNGLRDDLPLALELWPERVVGKAVKDVTIAEQHDLTAFLWYDELGVGLRPRRHITEEITREIERRGGDKR